MPSGAATRSSKASSHPGCDGRRRTGACSRFCLAPWIPGDAVKVYVGLIALIVTGPAHLSGRLINEEADRRAVRRQRNGIILRLRQLLYELKELCNKIEGQYPKPTPDGEMVSETVANQIGLFWMPTVSMRQMTLPRWTI